MDRGFKAIVAMLDDAAGRPDDPDGRRGRDRRPAPAGSGGP